MTCVDEFRNERGTDKASRTRDKYSHCPSHHLRNIGPEKTRNLLGMVTAHNRAGGAPISIAMFTPLIAF